MTMQYKDPAGGSNSNIGPQLNTQYYQRKALVEAAKETYFGQLADTTNMPKHFGKKIKKFHYLPLLDDANINDQGIDASGVSSAFEKTIIITLPDTSSMGNGYVQRFAVGSDTVENTAIANAESKANDIFKEFGVFNTDYATSKSAVEGLTPAWVVDDTTATVPPSGNLYGSSKDVGTVSSKLPTLTENGGRVNRVGFKRIELEGTLEKFGFFDEYTKESLDFDTDAELDMHINVEMVKGANEITEDALQIDLLQSAGIVRFGGDATTTSEITGNNGETLSVLSYEDLMRMSIDLDNNRCPKFTKIISGSRMVDTKTIDAARIMYIGSELVPTVRKMTDSFGNQAFIAVQHYAASGTTVRGEIGSIDQFRLVVVPEMMHWEGAGKAVTTNDGYRETGGNYDVFPMLVVGSGSFTTVGFQTDGKTVKFKIKHVKPETDTAYGQHDPYGEKGFMSIKWYYGFFLQRSERIALGKSVAQW